MSDQCPYCPPFDSGWGGSDDMWVNMKRVHDRDHVCAHGFQDPDQVCKTAWGDAHVSRGHT